MGSEMCIRDRGRGIDGVGNVCLCWLFIRFNVCSPESDIRHCVCVFVYRGVYGVWEEAEYVGVGAM